MDETNAVNTPAPAAAQTVVVDDNEARIASLEAEKAQLIVETANWKMAVLKEKAKKDEGLDSDEDERMTNIARRALADSRLAEIAREQDAIITKALKENKELKLAQLNRKEPGAAIGTHTESTGVQDTIVTPEQMASFKTRGWDDKKIERYKKNYLRYSGW